ncbi:CRISPR-associated helicase/endonuclease Cas3 [Aminobacterium colombiense]|uniref:CRISPR-associated helicase Cas3 n=1 Tax=Aminobacterium colombiense (strain DSM 12261 / ALA-1) TaxID=572547 RepID=D5ECJ3_AMICL|nr:CRISPR-associated helicase/endonuclease Cas3 [Aminobacterium colombiense]ADE56275.1 CRISPR-associated helicase Cas3 [Aminobacterium colombiense DSM 12261]
MTILAKKGIAVGNVTIQKTLLEHTQDVLNASFSLFGKEHEPKHLGEKWLSFFKIHETEFFNFSQNLKAAIVFHDIGKSNDQFQKALQGNAPQSLRHEFLGGWILSQELCRKFIESQGIDFHIIRASVMGHHLKLKKGILNSSDYDNPLIKILANGVQDILDLFSSEFNSKESCLLNHAIPQRINIKEEKIALDFDSIEKELRRSFPAQEPQKLRLLRAVRTALILADAAGSGLAREMNQSVDVPMTRWIDNAFDKNNLLSKEKIEYDVIAPRCTQIETTGEKKPFLFSEFQLASSTLPDRTCLLAPCGSGKTLAAWKWGSGVASRHPISRFIFLYPTRATATEGFRDYVSWAPETDGTLLHGTSNYELQGMFDNPDPRSEKEFLTNDRLFAVGLWQKRLFSATVDQFLGFMRHDYRSSCLLPLLADSAVVFDEIHSFDQTLFSALLGFLREFNVPALCMTASLPINRLDQLREAGLKIFPESIASFPDLKEKASAMRYRVKQCKKEEALEEALKAYKNGEKVLWVVNTVKRCQEIAMELQESFAENLLCYHSRFRLKDRQKWHKKLIEKFRDPEPMIAITTQVCEMSLDLSASLLISEFAPVTSLIQRMGRCNRYLEICEGGRILLYPPAKNLPYSKEDIEIAEAFVRNINNKTINQEDLQSLLEEFSPQNREMEKLLPFLNSDAFAFTFGGGIRDGDVYTVSAILESNINNYWNLRKQFQPIDGLILPAPQNCVERGNGLPSYLYIAKGRYVESLGLLV